MPSLTGTSKTSKFSPTTVVRTTEDRLRIGQRRDAGGHDGDGQAHAPGQDRSDSHGKHRPHQIEVVSGSVDLGLAPRDTPKSGQSTQANLGKRHLGRVCIVQWCSEVDYPTDAISTFYENGFR